MGNQLNPFVLRSKHIGTDVLCEPPRLLRWGLHETRQALRDILDVRLIRTDVHQLADHTAEFGSPTFVQKIIFFAELVELTRRRRRAKPASRYLNQVCGFDNVIPIWSDHHTLIVERHLVLQMLKLPMGLERSVGFKLPATTLQEPAEPLNLATSTRKQQVTNMDSQAAVVELLHEAWLKGTHRQAIVLSLVPETHVPPTGCRSLSRQHTSQLVELAGPHHISLLFSRLTAHEKCVLHINSVDRNHSLRIHDRMTQQKLTHNIG